MKKSGGLICGAILIMFCLSANGQTISSQQDGPWNQGSTWAGGVVPTAANSTSVIVNHNVTVTAAAYPSGSPLSIDQLTVSNSASANVIVNSGAYITLANGAGTDLTFGGAGGVSVSGYFVAKNGVTFSGNTTSNFKLLSGSTFEYQAVDPTLSLPTASYNSTSTLLINGFSAGGTFNASWNVPLGHVTYNCANQAASQINFGGFLSQIQGDFNVLNTGASGGRIQFNAGTADVINIGGNFSVSGTSRVFWTFTGNAQVNVTGAFSFAPSGAAGSSGFVLGTGTGVLSVGGNATMTGGSWAFSNSSGATGTFNFSGNLTCSTTFSAIAGSTSTISLIGSGAQQSFDPTGATFPSMLNVTVNGSAGVSLTGSLVTSGSTNLTQGTLTISGGNLTMNGPITAAAGTIATSGSPTITIGGSGAVPANLPITSGASFQTFNLSRMSTTLTTSSNFNVTNLQLYAGTLSNTGTITMANGGLVDVKSTSASNTGTLSNALAAAGTYNVQYTNDITYSSGAELPNSAVLLGSLTKLGVGTLILTKSVTVNGALTNSAGGITCNANDLTVSSFTNSATFNAPSSSAATGLTLNGNLTNTGTFNNNSGTVAIGGAVSLLNTVPTFNHLTINASGTLTSPASLVVQGNFTNNGSFVQGSNVVNFTGAVAQTISGTTNTQFYDVVLNKAGGFSATVNAAETITNSLTLTLGTLIVNSNFLTINSGATVNRAAGSITTSRPQGGPWNLVYAITTNTSTGFELPLSGSVGNVTLNNSSGTILALSQAINAGGAITISNSGSALTAGANNITAGSLTNNGILNAPNSSATVGLTLNGNFSNTGTFNNYSGTVLIGGPVSLLNAVPIFNHMTINASGTLTAPASLTVQGNFANNGAFVSGSNIVNFTGSAPQIISGTTNTQFYDVVMNKTGGFSVTVNAAETITNSLTLTLGSLIINSSLLTISSGATVTRGGGTITTSRPSGSGWNLIYTNTVSITTGFEIPSSGNLASFTMNNSSGTSISLAASQPLNVTGAFSENTAGTSFAAGSNDVSVGSLTNAGTFTAPTSSAATGLTLNGNFTNNGTFNNSAGTVVIGGTVSFLGSSAVTLYHLTINASGVLNAPSSLTMQGNFKNDGSFVASTGTLNFTGGAPQTMSGSSNTQFYNIVVNKVASSLIVSVAETVTNGLTLTLGPLAINSSLLTISSGATVTRTTGTVSTSRPSGSGWNLVYANSASLTTGFEIPSSGNLTSVTLNNSSGTTVTLAAAQPLNLTGAFTVSASGSAFSSGANNITAGSLANAGTFNAPSSAATTGLTLNGNLNNTGTFNNNSGTVIFGATATITGTTPTFNNLTVSASGVFTAPSALTIQGNLQNDGSFSGGTGAVTFSGNTAKQIKGAQKIVFNNISVIDGTQATDLSLESSAGADFKGILTMGASAVFDTDGAANNNVFTLLSTADKPTSDASVAALSSSSQLPGKIKVQRFMSKIGASYSYQIYRNISSPVNSTVFDLQSSIPITGPFTNASVIPGADASFSSMSTYDETVMGSANNGWTDAPLPSADSKTTSFVKGLGYSLFIYGSDSPISGQTNESWSLSGPVWSGSFNLPVTFTSSGVLANDGWNLVGNPYPSTIDWNSANWTKTNLDNALYFDDYSTNPASRATYINGVSTGGATNLIPIGQAFWVKANAAAPVLAIQEGVKVAGSQSTYFRQSSSSPQDLLRISLSNGKVKGETVIYFSEKYTDGYDAQYDALDFNPRFLFSLSSGSKSQERYAINALSPVKESKVVPLFITNPTSGDYTISFEGFGSFSSPTEIWLRDRFKNTLTDVRSNSSYSFSIDRKNTLTFGAGRFEVIFGTVPEESPVSQVVVYPNPVKGIMNVETNETEAFGEITDVLGQHVGYLNFEGVEGKIAKFNFAEFNNGIYLVRIKQGDKTKVVRIVKE